MPEKTACISIRITPLSASKYVGQRTHDLRLGEPPGYVDPGRTHLNTTLIEPPGLGNLKRHLADTKSRSSCRQKVVPKRVAYAGILTFSREAQKRIAHLSADEIERRVEASVEAVAEAHAVPVLGLVIHRDEAAPHAHFLFGSVRTDGTGRALRLAPRDTSAMQDLAAKAWEDLGIGRGCSLGQRIKAGESTSAIIHKNVKELHESLPEEIAAARAELEKTTAELFAHQRSLADVKARYEAAASRLREIQERIRQHLPALRRSKEIDRLSATVADRDAQIADLRHLIEDLSRRERQSVSVVRQLIRHLPAAERKRVEGNLGKLGRTDLAPGRPDRSRASTNQGFVSAG